MSYPFFILGNPRSGTSLFRLMLNSHPSVCVPPECGFLQWWHDKYSNWTKSDSDNLEKIRNFIEDILTSKKIEDWNIDGKMLVNTIFQRKPTTYSSLCYIVYENYSHFKKKVIGDKNNYYIHHLPLLDKIYPKSKYIHLVRDGRDVACSYLALNDLQTTSSYKPNISGNVMEISQEWAKNTSKIEYFISKKPSLTVRYEDLLISTVNVLNQVCSFLEVPYSRLMLSYYKTKFHDEPLSTIDWKKKTLQKVDKNNCGMYKDQLDENCIEIFNKHSYKELEYFGYEK